MSNFEFNLTGVDLSTKQGVLYVRKDDGMRYKLQVTISALLASCIAKQRKGKTIIQYENTTFKSDDKERLYKKNPLCLVDFRADGNQNGFKVEHVREGGRHKRKMYDSFNRMFFVEGYTYRHPSEFVRYRRVDMALADMSEGALKHQVLI